MAFTKINFDNEINTSLQIGDHLYVSDYTQTTGKYITLEPEYAGPVIDISSNYIVVDKDPATAPIIMAGHYISFAKNVNTNESSLKGYYADVTLHNESNEKAELFAISSDVALSSK